MASRSLNKVMLIGNLTRDPELRYTPNGTAVCSIGLATNRSYVSGDERREETEFHRLIAWTKLAELCSQLLKKGMKIYIEGRLQTRTWQTPDNQTKERTEIIIEDMMILTPKGGESRDFDDMSAASPSFDEDMPAAKPAKKAKPAADEDEEDQSKSKKSTKAEEEIEDLDDLDIPF